MSSWRQTTGSESPVVSRTFDQRQSVKSAQQSLVWAAINFLLVLVFYMEISTGSVLEHVFSGHPLVWYIECGLTILFSVNVIRDVLRYVYLGILVSSCPVELSDYQRAQMAVSPSELGFRSPVASNQPLTSTTPSTPIFSPSNFSPRDHNLSGLSTPTDAHTPYTTRYTPSPHHTPSPLSHYTMDRSGSPGRLGGSFMDQSISYGAGYNSSFSTSFQQSNAPSPLTPNLAPLFREESFGGSPQNTSGMYGLRSRMSRSPAVSPQVTGEDCISDLKALDVMLKEEREKEARIQLVSGESSPGRGTGPSFWRFNRSFSDYTPILRKYQYQIACRTPSSSKSAKDDDADESTTYMHEEVWRKIGVDLDVRERWVENLRKWLRETILVHVVGEITRANEQLDRCGCEDMQIGEVSISHLKQLALTKSQQVPHLNELIPFLEITPNQEYLITRIREIAKGGCMSDFNWNGGGRFKGKAWGEHLPTDCAIVMHLLCTYLDCRLPPNPQHPDLKTFTSQYFMKTPDKPDLIKKDNLSLYQSCINPPHYKVILQDDVWNPGKGRNNMFHAVLLFFHHIVVHERSVLGRVNLGMSGINIQWVLDR